MAAMLANRLDDVRVDTTGVTVIADPPTTDLANRVLVVQGTDKNDSIRVRPSGLLPGAVECMLNGTRTVFPQPLSAIVVHGRRGNDTITIDAAVPVDTFLFGGAGKDTLTGGSRNDVLVGGAGNDVLAGHAGRDLLVGGDNADILYGSVGGAAATTEEENLLLGNLLGRDHDLPFLRRLAASWCGDSPRVARVAEVSGMLGAGPRLDRYQDISYGASAADWIPFADVQRDQGWYREAGITRAWFSAPYRDANGFETYLVRSDFERTVTKIRVLLPRGFEPTKSYAVVYVLPVEAGDGTRYGDGLVAVKKLGLASSKEAIFVAPTFSDMPWYADHASNSQLWQETHFRSVVVPSIERRYPAIAAASGRLLLGFSKSGVGAFTMLLRHPDEFGRAFAFDSPLNLPNPNTGQYDKILGTKQNYENYRISTLLQQRAALLRGGPPRLFMTGYNMSSAREMDAQIDRCLDSLQVPHFYDPGYYRPHRWDSGWVAQAVDQLLA